MKILNFGSLNLDFVYRVGQCVRPGETAASASLETFCGGKGLNQSVALVRAGADVYHAGCVGEDGGELVELLRGAGVNTDWVQIVPGRTGHAVIQLEDGGQNSILLYGGANMEVSPEYADEVLAHFGAGDMVVLQNEISNVPYIISRARERGMIVAFNPSPLTGEVAGYPLDCVDYLLLNEIEGETMAGRRGPGRILTRLNERYPHMSIVLTLGERGSVYRFGNCQSRHNAYIVPVIDTTAAGDTFTGYFLAHITTATSTAVMETASAAAALAVTVKGAANSIPTLDEVKRFMDKQSSRCGL